MATAVSAAALAATVDGFPAETLLGHLGQLGCLVIPKYIQPARLVSEAKPLLTRLYGFFLSSIEIPTMSSSPAPWPLQVLS